DREGPRIPFPDEGVFLDVVHQRASAGLRAEHRNVLAIRCPGEEGYIQAMLLPDLPSPALNLGPLDHLAGEIVDDDLDFPSRLISIAITASDGDPLAVW